MLGLPSEWQEVSNLSFDHSGTKEDLISIWGQGRKDGG